MILVYDSVGKLKREIGCRTPLSWDSRVERRQTPFDNLIGQHLFTSSSKVIIIQWSKFDPHSAESEIKAEFLNVYFFCIIMKSLLSVTPHVLFYSQWKISNDHLAFFSSSLQNNQKLRNHIIIQVSSYLVENNFQVGKKSFSKPTRFSFGSDQFWGQNRPHRKCKKITKQKKKSAPKGLIKSANILKKIRASATDGPSESNWKPR